MALIASQAAASLNSPVAISAVNSTGAAFGIAFVWWDNGSTGTPTITDNKGNPPWDPGAVSSVGGISCAFFRSHNPIVGSGHTVTMTGTGSLLVGGLVVNFESTDVVADQADDASSDSVTSQQVGPITPPVNGALVYTGFAWSSGPTGDSTIDSPFTVSPEQINFTGGNYYGGALAYYTQATAAALAPTWSVNNGSSTAVVAILESFVPDSAPPAGVRAIRLMRTQQIGFSPGN